MKAKPYYWTELQDAEMAGYSHLITTCQRCGRRGIMTDKDNEITICPRYGEFLVVAKVIEPLIAIIPQCYVAEIAEENRNEIKRIANNLNVRRLPPRRVCVIHTVEDAIRHGFGARVITCPQCGRIGIQTHDSEGHIVSRSGYVRATVLDSRLRIIPVFLTNNLQ